MRAEVGDVPLLGDWDGNGVADLAIYRGSTWHIRSNAAASGSTLTTFVYGMQAGDRPIAGNWDGDGDEDAGIYRSGQWHLRSSAQASGSTTTTFFFGAANGQPVVGAGSDPAKPGIGTFKPKTT